MGKKHETFGKKEVRLKKEKKRKEKEQKKMTRGEGRDGNNLDDMIAYVDEYGNITSTPPDPTQRKAINLEDIEISIPKNTNTEEVDSVRHGIISFYNTSKGFGFIKDLNTQEDIFFHINGLEEPVKENNKVTFEVSRGPKGLNATGVRIDREQNPTLPA